MPHNISLWCNHTSARVTTDYLEREREREREREGGRERGGREGERGREREGERGREGERERERERERQRGGGGEGEREMMSSDTQTPQGMLCHSEWVTEVADAKQRRRHTTESQQTLISLTAIEVTVTTPCPSPSQSGRHRRSIKYNREISWLSKGRKQRQLILSYWPILKYLHVNVHK